VKKLFLIICIGTGLYRTTAYLKERKASQAYAAFMATEANGRPASQCGFKDILQLDGVDPQVITVLMPCGCPLEAGQRGRALVAKIKAANLPVTASSEVHAKISGQTREEVEGKMAMMNDIMGGETPIVVYKGRAKNNPTIDDVLAEYRAPR
jgi:hypothetical protein